MREWVQRLLEAVFTDMTAAVVLAALALVVSFLRFETSPLLIVLSGLVLVTFGTALFSLRKIRELNSRLAAIRYSEYFADEASVYHRLRELIKSAQQLRVAGLANTSVFHLFDAYVEFLRSGREIDVLCLDPEAEGVLDHLSRLVSIAAQEKVLPELASQLEHISLGASAKERIRRLLVEPSAMTPAQRMIWASLALWAQVGAEVERFPVNRSMNLHVYVYQMPPTLKGWIFGAEFVLKGDFTIPGYGLTEPQYLFSRAKAPTEVDNFIHTFQLFRSDDRTRRYRTGEAEDGKGP